MSRTPIPHEIERTFLRKEAEQQPIKAITKAFAFGNHIAWKRRDEIRDALDKIAENAQCAKICLQRVRNGYEEAGEGMTSEQLAEAALVDIRDAFKVIWPNTDLSGGTPSARKDG